MNSAAQTFDLTAPAGKTLTALAEKGDWEAWRGALVILAGLAANKAANKANTVAADIQLAVDQCESDYCGLATTCERTAAFLTRWVDCHLNGVQDYNGGTQKSYVRTLSDGRYLAVYRIYPGAF